MHAKADLTHIDLNKEDLKLRFNQIIGYLMQKDPIKYKNQNKISESLNINRSNLSSAINGDDRYLKYDSPVINSILSKFPEINKDWFRTGVGSMIQEEENIFNEISKKQFESLPIGNQLSLIWEVVLQIKTDLDQKISKQDDKIIKVLDFIDDKVTPMYDFIKINMDKKSI